MRPPSAGVSIRQPWDHDCVEFAFYEYRGSKLYAAKPVEFVWEEIPEGTEIPSTFWLPRRIAEDFIDELYKALTSFGKKSDGEHKLAGKLEATQYHLEDLRQLLKLKK